MTKSDFEQWVNSPITKEIMSQLKETRDAYRESLIGLAVSGDPLASAKVAGNIESFDYLLNIEFEGVE